MSSPNGSVVLPALNVLASLAGLYPPLSGLPLAVSVISSAISATKDLTNGTVNAPSGNATIANNGLCAASYCGSRPKFFDGTNTLPFCGKKCAGDAAAMQNHGQSTQTTTANCTVCHLKPKYFDGFKLHAYCGKACAKQAKAQQAASNGPTQIVTGANHLCQIPGCTIPAYKDAKGAIGKYCSKAHKKLSEEACLNCRKVPLKIGGFCSRNCANDIEKNAPCLIEIPKGHAKFNSVTDQFKGSWRIGNATPEVQKMYKVVFPRASIAKYEAYRDSVEANGKFTSRGRAPGNENRRWHGTYRECNIGDQGQTARCGSATCSLCNILSTSFDVGKRRGAGSFGCGIYSSSTSGVSNGYLRNNKTSKLKAMLLNKVVVGKAYMIPAVNTALTAPPAGFDSVIANKGTSGIPGDELVVFTNDAIRPAYLLMYDA